MRPAILIAVFILCPVAFTATIHVPADYTTIQEAIDAAANGDTVIVAPGTYFEKIRFNGKAITVQSGKGPCATVIDSSQNGRVVKFVDGEGNDSVLDGFTLRNGKTTLGGGIYCYFTSPTILNNIIIDNFAPSPNGDGAGICIGAGSPIIIGNSIIGNVAHGHGGGISGGDAPLIMNNFIAGNNAEWGGGIALSFGIGDSATIANNIICHNSAYAGGGISTGAWWETYHNLINNLIYENTASYKGGGIYCVDYLQMAFVANTIVWGNTPDEISDPDAGMTVTHCDVKGGWPGTGNIDSDPIFVDPANNDFHLSYNSPCRGSGDNTVPGLPDCDFEGDPRICHGTVDIGTDEFYRHLYITGDQTPGGNIQGKFVGLPGTTPVRLFIGLGGVRPTPLPTIYGDLWLLPPRISIPLVPIPTNGILKLSGTIPLSPLTPYDIPMQGLVGLNSDSLTNLCVLEVR